VGKEAGRESGRNAVSRGSWARNWAEAILLASLPFALHFTLDRFPETDAYYHLKHASVYVQKGPLYQEFPWHAHSAIGERGADLWFGFHLLLVPFSLFGDPLAGMRAASAFFLALLLLAVYWAARSERMPVPVLLPLLMLGAAPAQTWRWLALRPYLASLALAALLLPFAIRSRLLPVAISSLGIALVHPAFFWLAPMVAGTAAVYRGIIDRHWTPTPFAASVACALLGLLARPDAMDALALLRIQLLDLAAAMRENPFMTFGSEIFSLATFGSWPAFVPFLAIWLAAVGARLTLHRSQRRESAKTLVGFAATTSLAAVFALLSFFQTHRATELWTLFACLSIGYSLTALLARSPESPLRAHSAKKRGVAVSVCALGALLSIASVAYGHGLVNRRGRDANRFAGAMAWLRVHSAPGDIVYHTHWSFFAEMFLWNDHNRFITGMDPVFLWSHDRKLYWKFTGFELDATQERTTGAAPGEPVVYEDTALVLARDFGARFVLVNEGFTPKFSSYLRADPRFRLVYEDLEATVFELRLSRPNDMPNP